LYGIKREQVEIYATTQEIVDNYAESYVNERKDPRKQTTLVVNRKYNIESIKP
jgi:hypothetical protein